MQHPATYPDTLAGDFIRVFSKRNDVVYDPFLGSGTTAVMALKQERRAIGCEISPAYHRIALARIRKEVDE